MDLTSLPVLSILIFLNLFACLTLATLPNSKLNNNYSMAKICHRVSLGFSLVNLFFVLGLFFTFTSGEPGFQFVEAYQITKGLFSWKLGLDNLSLSMLVLLSILHPIIILASEPVAQRNRPKLYYVLLFVLNLSLTGVFLAQDILLFFTFWELELLPMYLLIAIWGSEERLKAANKFLIYTFLGGSFILLGLIFVYWLSSGMTGEGQQLSFCMQELATSFRKFQASDPKNNLWLVNTIFVLFAIGFCIKLPSVPFHTWLPEAHVQAPAPISMLLAGVMLKMGAYGLIRFSLEFFPVSLKLFSTFFILLGTVNILLAAVFALVQKDIKKIIAYSSISHMGFILLGLGSLSQAGILGAIFQMFSHGIISAGLFMIIGSIYERTHTRNIDQLSGLSNQMPYLFIFFLGLAMANLGLPFLSGFVGESLVFYGVFTGGNLSIQSYFYVALATIGVIITAGYMLFLGKKIFYGKVPEGLNKLSVLRFKEKLILGILLSFSLFLGVYPKFLSEKIEPQTFFSSSLDN